MFEQDDIVTIWVSHWRSVMVSFKDGSYACSCGAVRYLS